MSAIDPIAAGEPESKSADLVAENLAALKVLFPQAFVEGGVDFDALRQLLGDAVDDGDERYGLNWSGKRQARRMALTPSLGTLRPAKDDSVDWDTTKNLMIEGDNLEVLKLLQKSYAGQVKLIYIDPPYNTGNDFVYPDDYTDSIGNYMRRTGQSDEVGVKNTSNAESSGRYHTDWLNMILPRLMLARNFLSMDGLMMVSCDETELARYIQVIEEVFGESNLAAIFAVRTPNQTEEATRLKNLDFLIVVARDIEQMALHLDRKDQSARCTTGNPSQTQPEIVFQPGIEVVGVPDGDYDQPETTGGMEDILVVSGRLSVRGGRLAEAVTLKARWSNPNDLRAWNARILAKSDAPLRNKFGKELTRLWFKGPRFQPQMDKIGFDLPESILDGFRSKGGDEVQKLMGAYVFDYPKHTSLIGYLIKMGAGPGHTVMDFFAGSGTTGHAVMAQNAIDGADRRFILVQLPEPLDPANTDHKAAIKLCGSLKVPPVISELTKERLRRAGEAVGAGRKTGGMDTGFRVYRLDRSNLKAWSPEAADLKADILNAVDNLVAGRTEDDLLVELLLKQGIDLTEAMVTREVAGHEVHAFGQGAMVACLADVSKAGAESLANGIADWVEELSPPNATTFFFKDSGFEDNRAKANLAAILEQRLGDRLLKVRSL